MPLNIECLRALIQYQQRSRPEVDINVLFSHAVFGLMQDMMSFVQALSNASTSDPASKLSSDALHHLYHPPNVPLVIEDPAIRQSISTYLALENVSQAAYDAVAHSLRHNFSGVPEVEKIQSFYNVEKLVKTYTGIEAILHDMCPNTCLAFTGPYSNLDECPMYRSS